MAEKTTKDPKKSELLQIFEKLDESGREMLIIVARVAAIRAENNQKQQTA